jgi:RNA polymerase sigma factor (sigma-70 family)
MSSVKDRELSELVSAIKAGVGSDEAFAELESRYLPLMKKRAISYFESAADRSEALQEARIALHNAALSYDSENFDGVTFGLYADVCICNKLRTLLRIVARNSFRSECVSEAERLVKVGGVEASIAAKDLCNRVMKIARGELSDFEFEVFKLGFERYSTADIAQMLGKTAKAVDNAKYRLSRRLRENREICDILLDI